MKIAATFLALVGSAAAFAPVAQVKYIYLKYVKNILCLTSTNLIM